MVIEVSRAGCPGKPVAARGLVNGRGPRRQAWEGWSEAEGLRGTMPANEEWKRRCLKTPGGSICL